jgi:hypothetical protein
VAGVVYQPATLARVNTTLNVYAIRVMADRTEYFRAYQAKRRAAAIADDLCIECAVRRRAPDVARCKPCLKNNRDAARLARES